MPSLVLDTDISGGWREVWRLLRFQMENWERWIAEGIMGEKSIIFPKKFSR